MISKELRQKYIEFFGSDMLNSLKCKPYYSAPANYGCPNPPWDDNGVHTTLGIKFQDIAKIMEKEELYHE